MRSWVRYAKWLVIAALVVGANGLFYSSGYNSGLTTGAHGGITTALNDVAKRGYGEWVVVGATNDGLPDTKFHWFQQSAPSGGFLPCPAEEVPNPPRSILKQPIHTDDSA